jgi:hypothetical protein
VYIKCSKSVYTSVVKKCTKKCSNKSVVSVEPVESIESVESVEPVGKGQFADAGCGGCGDFFLGNKQRNSQTMGGASPDNCFCLHG